MCTTIIVTPGATTDGSMYVTHSDDNELSDERLVYVPAADHPAKSKRPVYPHLTGYPRLVCEGVAPPYDLSDFKKTEPLGYIPQVAHTFAYYDSCYGIMNEHQLCFGECTDAAQKYERKNGDAKHLFYSAELSRVALERCKTAREAITLMGDLIDKYGYYGTGETLPVGDTKEAWVMEMCAVPDGKGLDGKGLWVAKKVRDGEIWVGANTFTIREIDTDDKDNFMYSPKLFEVAEQLSWWNPKEGMLDWLKTASWGEYSHPYYSLRRIWSVLSRANPSLDLPPYVENGYTREYPFSVEPEKPMHLKEVMALHRSHYEGTEFDMAKKPAAGPFGNPNRYYDYDYDNSSSNLTVANPKLWGAFERPVSVYYTGYVYVCQARKFLADEVGGVLWFGYDQPSTTCFVPFYAGATGLPDAYQYGSMNFFDKDFAFWAFNSVSNLVCLKYCYMITDIVAKQEELEGGAIDSRADIEENAMKLLKKDREKARAFLTERANNDAKYVIDQWWELLYFLMFKYSDGYDNAHTKLREDGNRVKDSKELPYPLEWRKAVGYAQGPTTYDKHK